VDTAIGLDLDVAVEIGAKHADLRAAAKGRQRLTGRMAVLVALARRDHRHGRPSRVEQSRCGRGVGSVVPDLEEVDARQQPARRHGRLDRCLGIAGE
jgi:hypothetical protein